MGVLATPDPASTVATRAAGLIEFHARLEWDRPGDAPPEPACAAPGAAPGPARCDLVERTASCGTTREVSARIRALTERDLGDALERMMRSVSAAAALSGAVLEARAFRLAPPRATPRDVLEALALDLWRAGFPVRFAPSWTPVPAGVAALGFGGMEQDLRDFLRAHPAWEEAGGLP